MSLRPVVVVTGANAGVGYGICRRLLFQLCLPDPPDSSPQAWERRSGDTHEEEPVRYDGLTLIMACRSTQRAEAARKTLYADLDAHVAGLRVRPNYDGHADAFRNNLKIEIEYLDLSVLSTVFNFAAQIAKRHTYISHLIFNAGVANFTGIDWPACMRQLATSVLDAITRPRYNLQSVGEVSVDGFGWIWQSNVFGHYVLFRELEPLLKCSTYAADARVVWSSSLESSPRFFDSADWQLTKTAHSYESCKYQIDLIAPILDRRALQDPPRHVRHFISQPGVCHTAISSKLATPGGVLDHLKVLSFYFGRILFGSRHHPISAMNSAVVAVHLILVSISYITFGAKNDADAESLVPIRFGAETDRWGNPEVGTTPVEEWKEHAADGEILLGKCEDIYRGLVAKQNAKTPAL
ncbi:hypothetical protein B0H15DRAFT_909161 [Mycena belliarum]|uniref:3-keto-steroid reductase n=1 Tax=Mycena belliarum TaxID=1033014 RepID=A0AAD6U6B9_9AGAR|nr:hypothetical protein B0H15DRAFT_909161 [Mycena belliae]